MQMEKSVGGKLNQKPWRNYWLKQIKKNTPLSMNALSGVFLFLIANRLLLNIGCIN